MIRKADTSIVGKRKGKSRKRRNTNGLKYMKKWFSLEIKDAVCMKCHFFVHEIGKMLEKEG